MRHFRLFLWNNEASLNSSLDIMVKNNSAQKSVKTGDTAAPIAGTAAAMMLAAAAGILDYRRRRETR